MSRRRVWLVGTIVNRFVFVLRVSGADWAGKGQVVTVRYYPQGYDSLEGQQHDHDGQDLTEVRYLLPLRARSYSVAGLYKRHGLTPIVRTDSDLVNVFGFRALPALDRLVGHLDALLETPEPAVGHVLAAHE